MARRRKKRKKYGLPKPVAKKAVQHGSTPSPPQPTGGHDQSGGGQSAPHGTPPGGYKPGKPGNPAPYPGDKGGTPSAVQTGTTPSDYDTSPAPPGKSRTPDPYKPTSKYTKQLQRGSTPYKSPEQRRQALRNEAAKEYKQRELSEIALRNYEVTPEGKVKYEKEKVPIPRKGVTQDEIDAALRRHDKAVAKFKERIERIAPETTHKQIKKAVDKSTGALLVGLYKINKKGELKTKTVRVPKIKTSPEAVAADLREMRQNARDIRHSKGVPLSYKTVTGQADVDEDAGIISDVGDFFKKVGSLPPFGLPSGPVDDVRDAITDSDSTINAAGLRVIPGELATDQVLAQFNRPLRATEAWQGKLWTELGFIKGDTADKIRAAKGPIEAFLADQQDTSDLVTGADLSQGIFGGPQGGIVFDLALDPLMSLGGSGLAAAAPLKAAKLEAMVARSAPEALKTAQYLKLGRDAIRTGDHAEMIKYLDNVIDKRGLSRRPLGPLARYKIKHNINKGTEAVNRELRGKVRIALDNAPEAGGKSVILPGKLAQEVAARAVAAAQRERRLRPGFQINVGSPLNPNANPWVSIKVPLSENIMIPTKFTIKSDRARAVTAGVRSQREIKAIEDTVVKSNARLDELAEELAEARKSGDIPAVGRAKSEMQKEMSKITNARVQAAEDIKDPVGNFEKLGEYVARRNRQRVVREAFRLEASLARMIDADLQMAVHRAIKKIQDDEQALLRVSVYRHRLQDSGDAEKLFDELGPLRPDERDAVDQLAIIDQAMGQHGKAAGTINALVENYATRIVQRTGRPMGKSNENPLEKSQSLGAGPSGPMYAARHRQQPELSSLADPEVLARAIQDASLRPISAERARDLAEQWHRMGTIRANIEQLARALQRGTPINAEDLTEMELRALDWSRFVGQSDDGALFAIDGDGFLHLADSSYKYGFDQADQVFQGLTDHGQAAARLHSAMLDRARAEEVLRNVTPDTEIYEQWARVKERLDDEVAEYDIPAKEFGATAKDARANAEAASARLREIDDELEEAASKYDEARGEYEQALALYQRVKESGDPILTVRAKNMVQKTQARYERITDAMNYLPTERGRVARSLAESQSRYDELRAELKRDEKYGFEWGSNTPVSKIVADDYDRLVRRNIHSYNESILPGMKPITANRQPHNDPFDFTGRLDDMRKPGDKTFFEMDPRVAQVHRIRVEALKTSFVARWRGLDKVMGISLEEAAGNVGTLRSGAKVHASDLKRLYTPEGDFMGWVNRETEEFYNPTDIFFDDKLLPVVWNADGRPQIYFNPKNQQEYMRPAEMDTVLGREIQDKIGEDKLWPVSSFQDVKGELLRMGDTGYENIFQAGLDSLFNRTLSLLRYSVTVPFPAYHIRNMVSDVIKSLQADTGVAFHPVQNMQLRLMALGRNKIIKVGKHELRFGPKGIKVPGFKGRLTTEEFLLITDLFGVRSSRHLAEFLDLTTQGKVPSKWQRRLSPGPKGRTGHGMIELGARREDLARYRTFMQRMRRNGGDPADAAYYMIKHHFDYADIPARERKTVRNLFLFYTWYRKNIPLQFMEMITRPGFFSAISSIYSEAQLGGLPFQFDWSQLHPLLPDMSGPLRTQNLIPDYMVKDLAAISLPWNGHAMTFAFGAPWNDINYVMRFFRDPQGAVRNILALSSPVFTIMYQLASQKDILTGRDLKAFEPTAPQLAALMKEFGLGGWVETDEDGNPVVPWALAVAIRNLPFFGRASSYAIPKEEIANQGWIQRNRGLFGAMLGLNIQVGPRKKSEIDYKIKLFENKVAEGLNYGMRLSNLDDDRRDKLMKKWWNTNLYPWAKAHHIGPKIWKKIDGHPRYVTEEEKSERSQGRYDLGGAIGSGIELTTPGGEGRYNLGDAIDSSPEPSGGSPLLPPSVTDAPSPQEFKDILEGGADGNTPPGTLPSRGPVNTEGSRRRIPASEQDAPGPVNTERPVPAGPRVPPGLQAKLDASPMTRAQKRKIIDLVNLGSNEMLQYDNARQVAKRLVRVVKHASPAAVDKFADAGPAAREIAEAAVEYGPRFGIRPSLLMAIAENETAFGAAAGLGTPGSGALSTAGAQGYMQFMPPSRDAILKEYGFDAFSKDPKEAVAAAAAYFDHFAPDAKSDYDRALSYNHADWYASQVVKDQQKYTALDHATPREVPTKLKREARQVIGKKATAAILAGGTLMVDDTKGKVRGEPKSAADEIEMGLIKKATPKQLKYFTTNDPNDRVWFDPILMQQLIKLSKATGQPIAVNSGFRTRDEQKASYADYLAGGATAAVPGSSNHEYGLAADLTLTSEQRSRLGEYGLGLPVPGEDWHVEVVDPKLKEQQTAINLGTSAVPENIGPQGVHIKGTKLMVVDPVTLGSGPTVTGTSGYSSVGGVSSTGALPSSAQGAGMSQEDRVMSHIRATMKRQAFKPTDIAKMLENFERQDLEDESVDLSDTYLEPDSISTTEITELLDRLRRERKYQLVYTR